MYDITLIGGGIMSSTLGILLKELNPRFRIQIIESQDEFCMESSGAWNNAGTGHAGYCELNFTPEENGDINLKKAFDVTEAFSKSLQFWSYLVKTYGIDPVEFIRPIPHMSFVQGSNDVEFLKKRYDAMKDHHFYHQMEFTTDPKIISEWAPLVMNGRKNDEIAATRVEAGTDMNYGRLTQLLMYNLMQRGVHVKRSTVVKNLKRDKESGSWRITYKDKRATHKEHSRSKFVFVGAGGATLLLLEKTKIPEIKGYGGFPISGQWLVCNNPEVIKQHHAKVYGKASIGAPPMSVPHLDSRIIDGVPCLLFGPYAGFSTKFLKHGSYLDLFKSIKISNLFSMLRAGINNIPLTRYLVKEVRASFDDKFNELRKFYPEAWKKDWAIKIAGQRVQVIQKDKEKGGVLIFGTKVIVSSDKTMAGLTGASPGASTAVDIMVKLIEECFPELTPGIKKLIPSYGQALKNNPELFTKIENDCNSALRLSSKIHTKKLYSRNLLFLDGQVLKSKDAKQHYDSKELNSRDFTYWQLIHSDKLPLPLPIWKMYELYLSDTNKPSKQDILDGMKSAGSRVEDIQHELAKYGYDQKV